MADRTCTVEGCKRPHIAKGFCTLHYRRWSKHGDSLWTAPSRKLLGACTVDGCERDAIARGWCSKHYDMWKRTGDPNRPGYGQPVESCIIAGCDRPGTGPRGLGWCNTHYRRYQRHGSPYVTSRIVGDDVIRFETYIRQGEAPPHDVSLGRCWLWVGPLNADGYGVMQVQDLPTASAHRWSYRHHIGPLLDSLELDHLCRVRRCVNPWHLEQTTHLVNIERANAIQFG